MVCGSSQRDRRGWAKFIRAGGVTEHPRRIRTRARLRGGAGRAEPLARPQQCPDRGLPSAVGGELCRAAGLGPIAGPLTKDVANCLTGMGGRFRGVGCVSLGTYLPLVFRLLALEASANY